MREPAGDAGLSQMERAPSLQALLKATAIASIFASALNVAIHFWRTPLGWSPGMIMGLFGIGAVLGFILAAVVALSIGLSLARMLDRKSQFRPAILMLVGAVLGATVSILLSALGNSYVFMSGPGFWQSFTVEAFTGFLAGGLWWAFEKTSGAEP